jgi:hypothetical protein
VNEQSFSIRVHNSRTLPLNLFLEPWGEVHQLGPDKKIRIEAKGPDGRAGENMLEIQSGENGLTVWGWEGSGVTLHEL